MKKILLSILCFLMVSSVFAQQKETKKLDTVVVQALRQRSYTPPKTVSPSTRITTPINELSQNIQVVGQAILRDQNAFSMYDNVTRNAAGLFRVGHWQNFARINARGTRATGLRNGTNIGVSFWAPLTEDLSVVERVEFIKGPAGFMLANSEPGGSYNVVTKKPTGKNKGSFTTAIGTLDTYRASADFDGRITDKLWYRLNLAAENSGSHRRNEFTDTYVVAPVLKYLATDKTSITLEANIQRKDFAIIGSNYAFSQKKYKEHSVDFSLTPSNIPPSKAVESNFFVAVDHQINDDWNVFSQVSYMRYDQEGTSMWISSVEQDSITRQISIWDAFATAKNAQVFLNGEVKTGRINHRIIAGIDMNDKKYLADWNQNKTLDKQAYKDASKDLTNAERLVWDRSKSIEERGVRYSYNNYASAYLQDELGFFDNDLRLTLALRHTNLKNASPYQTTKVDENKFTPRFGLSYSLTNHTDFYAMYDEIFLGNFGTDYQGNTFKAQTGANYEVGFKQRLFNDQLNVSASGYRAIKQNLLTQDVENADSNGRFTFNRTAGEALIQGIEIDVMGQITPNLSVVFNHAYCDAKITKDSDSEKIGRTLPDVVTHIQNTWLTYQFTNFMKGLRMSMGYILQMDRKGSYHATLKQQDDYFRLDAAIGYVSGNMSLNLTVNNLMNEYLYTGTPVSNYYYWQAEPLRNFRLALTYNF